MTGKHDTETDERARYEARRFHEMVHAERERQETLAKVRAEFERRAAEGDSEAQEVIAELDAHREGCEYVPAAQEARQ